MDDTAEEEFAKLEQEKEVITTEIKELKPSKIIKEFIEVIKHPQNALMLTELSKLCRELSKRQTDCLKELETVTVMKHY